MSVPLLEDKLPYEPICLFVYRILYIFIPMATSISFHSLYDEKMLLIIETDIWKLLELRYIQKIRII